MNLLAQGASRNDISQLNATDNQLLQGIGQRSDVNDLTGPIYGTSGLPPRRNSDKEVEPVLPTKYLTPNMEALKQAVTNDSP